MNILHIFSDKTKCVNLPGNLLLRIYMMKIIWYLNVQKVQ